MKIVIAGASPCLLSSRGKIHAWLAKHLYLSGHAVMGVSWGHDENYSALEDGKFHFEFEHENVKHRIPIVSISPKIEPSIAMHEIIQDGNPNIILTIGSIEESSYMHAIKQFNPTIKWMAILTNYAFPISNNKKDIINDMDAILCSSQFCYEQVRYLYDGEIIDKQYVGCDTEIFKINESVSPSQFKIVVCANSSPIKNIATIMESVSRLRQKIPSISLYIHTNVYDHRSYDLISVRERIDSGAEFIKFPNKYVSMSDGITDEEMRDLLQSAHLYISIPLVSATSMGVFHALACGCFPILSDCGSNKDISNLLEKHLDEEICRNNIIVPGINFMTKGETYLNICDPCQLEEKIMLFYKNYQNHKGLRKQLFEFAHKYDHGFFIKASKKMLDTLEKSDNSSEINRIRPETVGTEIRDT